MTETNLTFVDLGLPEFILSAVSDLGSAGIRQVFDEVDAEVRSQG